MKRDLCVGLISISFMHTRAAAGDEGDGANRNPRLATSCLPASLAPRGAISGSGRDFAGDRQHQARGVDAFVHVEGMGQRQHRMLGVV